MNYHFTTTKAHIVKNGGRVVELVSEWARFDSQIHSKEILIGMLKSTIAEVARTHSFVRGSRHQPDRRPTGSKNTAAVAEIVPISSRVLDASLFQDNLYFMKVREEECRDLGLKKSSSNSLLF